MAVKDIYKRIVAVKVLLYEINLSVKNPKIGKHVRKIDAIAAVAGGYGGDMPEERVVEEELEADE